jgi:MFS family permease
MTPTAAGRVSAAVSRRAYLVIGAAVCGYIITVMQRTSFGVAGIEAAHRFGANATILGLFVAVQLVVYAALQVPVGIALDRFGSRRLVTTGLLTAAIGQLGLALVSSIGWALVARVLIGAGDACIFISVIRLIPAWMPPRRVPVMTQLVGMLGQIGQVLSAVPLLALLHSHGWVPMFATAAGVGVGAALLVFALVRDRPAGGAVASVVHAPEVSFRAVLAEPGNWLGFWSHFVTGFTSMVVVMIWGVPFLVSGEALSTGQAGALLIVNSATSALCGPIVGTLTARHPLRRSWIVLGSAGATATAWAVVLLSPGRLPFWVLALWMVVIATGGPVSLVGFDFARSFNQPRELGRASGIVNGGGFLAAVISILMVSVVLDAVSPAGARTYDLDAYRLGFTTLALPWLVGVVGVIGSRRRTRASMAAGGVVVPPLRDALARERQRRSEL